MSGNKVLLIVGAVVSSMILVPSLSKAEEIRSISERNKLEYNLFMCLGINKGMPIEAKTTFLTSDKIYVLIKWYNINMGKHKLEVYWNNPKGETQEYYAQDFIVTTGAYDTWSWLQLEEAMIFSDFGMSFVGQWSVDIYLDDEFITTQKFNVQ